MTFDFHFRSPSTGGGGRNISADSDELAVAAAVVGRALLAVLAGTTERGVAVVAWAVVGAVVPVEVRAAVGAAVPVVVRVLLVVPVEATGLGLLLLHGLLVLLHQMRHGRRLVLLCQLRMFWSRLGECQCVSVVKKGVELDGVLRVGKTSETFPFAVRKPLAFWPRAHNSRG